MINRFRIEVEPKLIKYKNYYDGIQSILNKSYNDASKPCNKTVTNYCKNIVDSYTGYLATPGYISYTSDDNIEDVPLNTIKSIVIKKKKSEAEEKSKIEAEPEIEEEENDNDSGYFTETLARIYIKQGRYSKALEIIRRLNLIYPKKSRYFADQIRFLEKLIINDNKTKDQNW